MIACHSLTACLACGHTDLTMVLSLGHQPLANQFTETPAVLPAFPLHLMRCRDCGHLQLSGSVDRAALFTDYIYRSGTTETLRAYFRWFAAWVTERHGVGRVLDIACNDGSQLDAFRELGWRTYGVDPAANLSPLNRHPHRVAFFDEDCTDLGHFDVIVAQNVVAHTDDPLAMLATAGTMTDHLYVQTSQARMVERGEFDTIYHEHLSFFTPRSMGALAARAGLAVQDVTVTPIHGDSFVFHIGHGKPAAELPGWSEAQVHRFAGDALTIIEDLREMLRSHGHVVGYGAAAKAMTVLNAVGVGPAYIVDDAVEKQGRFAPGIGTPILAPSVLAEESAPLELIPLAWNFHDEIVQRVRQHYTGPLRTLRYFPEVRWS